MCIKNRFKDKFTKAYLLPQNKRWVRIVDALAAVFCFASAIIALYLLNTQLVGKLPAVSNVVVWTYLIASLPLAVLLYRKSDLKRYERYALVLFILSSSMSLLLSVTSLLIKS